MREVGVQTVPPHLVHKTKHGLFKKPRIPFTVEEVRVTRSLSRNARGVVAQIAKSAAPVKKAKKTKVLPKKSGSAKS